MLHTQSDAAVIGRTELSAAVNPPGVATRSLRSVERAVRAQWDARHMRSGLARWDDPVEDFALPDHAERFAGGALLGDGIGLERACEALERVELGLQFAHRLTLGGDLTAQLEPIEGRILSGLERQPREHEDSGETDEPRTCHSS